MEEQFKNMQQLSRHLFIVLEKVGASENMRRVRQHASITREILMAVTQTIKQYDTITYIFGSSCEGTTTPGLQSDIDTLICSDAIPVVEQLVDNENDVCFLMIQDDLTPPGYTKLLQIVNNEIPTNGEIRDNDEILDAYGRPVFSNKTMVDAMTYDERNGPAATTLKHEGNPDLDYVPAFRCKTWPAQANDWLQKKRPYAFPSSNIKDDFEKYGCFVVPTGHPQSSEQPLQWRLSFSIQERMFMCQLNPVQYKCYIVMKMIKNDFIKSAVEGKSLTSYHCKTCLFYVIEQTDPTIWETKNLIACVAKCLMTLKHWLKDGYIPNFFISKENMWKGPRIMRLQVVNVLQNVLCNLPGVCTLLECDLVGKMLIFEMKKNSNTPSGDITQQNQDETSANEATSTSDQSIDAVDNVRTVNRPIFKSNHQFERKHLAEEQKTIQSVVVVDDDDDDDDDDSALVDSIITDITMGQDDTEVLKELSNLFPGYYDLIEEIACSNAKDALQSMDHGIQDRDFDNKENTVISFKNRIVNQNSKPEHQTNDIHTSPTNDEIKDAERGADLAFYRVHYWTIDSIVVSAKELVEQAARSGNLNECICEHTKLIEKMLNITDMANKMEHTEDLFRVAINYILPFIYTSLGSQLAAKAIYFPAGELKNTLLEKSNINLMKGHQSDAMSGNVKHAAILLKQGDLSTCKTILNKLDTELERHVTSWGRCLKVTNFVNETLCSKIKDMKQSTSDVLRESSAICVLYVPTETSIVPKELRYEMFRSVFAQEARAPGNDDWFDCAVVDSRTYIYFLLYRLNERLGDPREQKKAQLYLMMELENWINLGHPDTANNLLGCILKEQGEVHAAWQCFTDSWKWRPDHNAAKWHMAIMLSEAVTELQAINTEAKESGQRLDNICTANGEEKDSDSYEVLYRRTGI